MEPVLLSKSPLLPVFYSLARINKVDWLLLILIVGGGVKTLSLQGTQTACGERTLMCGALHQLKQLSSANTRMHFYNLQIKENLLNLTTEQWLN